MVIKMTVPGQVRFKMVPSFKNVFFPKEGDVHYIGGADILPAPLSSKEEAEVLKELGTEDVDIAILENVGNLVCPAEFDTGAVKNMAILSVPEGHDKPLKYPLVFQVCDAMIINKIDVLPYFDFDMEKVREFARRRNPNIQIFPISAKTGEGVDALAAYLKEKITQWKK